jgi:DUF2997 family protein
VKTITIRIAKDGSIRAETHGLKGLECLPYISRIAALTDAEVVDSYYTTEFYEAGSDAGLSMPMDESPETKREGS